jgi:hypothetical protein
MESPSSARLLTHVAPISDRPDRAAVNDYLLFDRARSLSFSKVQVYLMFSSWYNLVAVCRGIAPAPIRSIEGE